MKFSEQTIKLTYDHLAHILNSLKYDPDLQGVESIKNDINYLYQAVYNDYRIRSISLNKNDFFYDQSHFQKIIDNISIQIQISGGMIEQNVILYHVNDILNHVVNHFKQANCYYNIGYVGIDLQAKQLFLTDIENRNVVRYQLVIDRDIDRLYGNDNSFAYYIRFRYVSCKEEF